MITIRKAELHDEKFWFRLDEHIPKSEFERNVRNGTAYVLSDNARCVGLLRYGLFWDEIPFCNLLCIEPKEQHKGYGTRLLQYWEKEMKSDGYGVLLTSAQSDESSQNFYRKNGFTDCGCLFLGIERFTRTAELFFMKKI